RRKRGEDRGDLLSMLLHAQDEESGRRMSDRQLRDEVMTLFMAGHEATRKNAPWKWALLARNPAAEGRRPAGVDPAPRTRLPTSADLPRLKYAERVISETLRICPTVWVIGREAIEPVELGGYSIPAGTTVFLPQWVIHRDGRWFDNPEVFRPERWDGGFAQ